MDMDCPPIVDKICSSLKSLLYQCLLDHARCSNLESISKEKIPVKRKAKDLLKSGDIVLPHFICFDDSDVGTMLLDEVQKRVKEQSLPVRLVTQDAHNLVVFFLDRPVVTRLILKEVLEQKSKYGHRSPDQDHHINLRPFADDCHDGEPGQSPMHLRMLHVVNHLCRVLQACGYKVHCEVSNSQSSSLKSQSPDCPQSNYTEIEKDFVSSAKNLLSEQAKEQGEESNLAVDLTPIIARKKFSLGKDGINKNLTKAEVFSSDGQMTDVLKGAITLEDYLSRNGHWPCINVVPQSRVFKLQQTICLHAALSSANTSQFQLTVGPVVCDQEMSVDEIHRYRYEQMKEASEMRHGVKCEGPEWDAKIHSLSEAGIKFDVLGTAVHCPLKLDLRKGTENRMGAFVLYNAARLATLLKHFTQQVVKGFYPPLPEIEEIDFALLRETEEWELVYVYVSAFPELVASCVETVHPAPGKLTSKIHTHKITNFLMSFSKCLSSYYSRYHILGGRESHLLPTMFARLHLVEACYQVMVNALLLIDVSPLDEI